MVQAVLRCATDAGHTDALIGSFMAAGMFHSTKEISACFYLFPGIFGQRLEDTVQFEKKFGPRLAPLLVEQCVDFIRERGLDEEGLFRMPGQANLVKELQESFDCGDKPLFDR